MIENISTYITNYKVEHDTFISFNKTIYSHSSEPRNPFKKAFTAKSIERNVKSRNVTPTPKFTTNSILVNNQTNLGIRVIIRGDIMWYKVLLN